MNLDMLIEVGGRIGALPTIALTVLTAVLGLSIVRVQGLTILGRMQTSLSRGEPPVAELVHGFFLLIAGVCLFIPGFVSDGIGILLLIPPIRALVGRLGLQGLIISRKKPTGGRDAAGNLIIEGDCWESPEAGVAPGDRSGGPTERAPEDDREHE